MEKETFRLVIEKVANGFTVYVNQDFATGAVRPLPYVFESIENLFKFIEQNY